MANRQGDVDLRFAQVSAPSSNFGLLTSLVKSVISFLLIQHSVYLTTPKKCCYCWSAEVVIWSKLDVSHFDEPYEEIRTSYQRVRTAPREDTSTGQRFAFRPSGPTGLISGSPKLRVNSSSPPSPARGRISITWFPSWST